MAHKQIFFGRWEKAEDVYDSFFEPYFQPPEWAAREYPIPKDDFLKFWFVFALYDEVFGYDGEAIVVFIDKNELFIVEGSHCSCNGLEGQWQPQKISSAYLKLRKNPYNEVITWHQNKEFYEKAHNDWDKMVRELTEMTDDFAN